MSRPQPEVIMSFQDGGFYSQQALLAAVAAVTAAHTAHKAEKPRVRGVGEELKLRKEDVELVMYECDYSKGQAEKALREHEGSVERFFDEYVKPVRPKEGRKY